MKSLDETEITSCTLKFHNCSATIIIHTVEIWIFRINTSQDLLKAIKATLANNNGKSYLTIKTPDDIAYLKSARRGYVHGKLAIDNDEKVVYVKCILGQRLLSVARTSPWLSTHKGQPTVIKVKLLVPNLRVSTTHYFVPY